MLHLISLIRSHHQAFRSISPSTSRQFVNAVSSSFTLLRSPHLTLCWVSPIASYQIPKTVLHLIPPDYSSHHSLHIISASSPIESSKLYHVSLAQSIDITTSWFSTLHGYQSTSGTYIFTPHTSSAVRPLHHSVQPHRAQQITSGTPHRIPPVQVVPIITYSLASYWAHHVTSGPFWYLSLLSYVHFVTHEVFIDLASPDIGGGSTYSPSKQLRVVSVFTLLLKLSSLHSLLLSF